MKKIPKGILFDFDGVLADTMEDLFLSWKNAFSKFGVEIAREDYFPLEGTKVIEVSKIISKKYNLTADPEEILRLKNEFYLLNHSFSFYPGVVELIDNLVKNKIKLAMVSASPREKLEKTVPKYFLEKFDVIVSGDDTSRGKPDPEPYLEACKKLGLSPDECVVVENAPLGITSAKKAGIYCIAISSTLNKNLLAEADRVIERFNELKNEAVIERALKSF